MSRIAPPRIDYVDRQMLGGGDLRASQRYLDARRARHIRGIHHTWGVAVGLDLGFGRELGLITISCGLAYDHRGRELLVPRPVAVRASEVAIAAGEDIVVALRSRGDGAIPAADARIVSEHDPLRLGPDVPLGRVTPQDWSADQRSRPHVAMLAPPRVRSGSVGAGGGMDVKAVDDCLQATIDTTAAGFEQTPLYLVEALRPSAGLTTDVIGPLLAIVDTPAPMPTSFTVQLRYVAKDAAQIASLPPTNVPRLPISLAWIGYEPPPRFGASDAPEAPCNSPT